MTLRTSLQDDASNTEEFDLCQRWSSLLSSLSPLNPADNETPVSLMIVAHVTYRSSVLMRCLHTWRQRLDASIERQRWQLCLALEWYTRRRLFIFFRAWQWRYRGRWVERNNMQQSIEHHRAVCLGKPFHAWRHWILKRRRLRRNLNTLCVRCVFGVLLRRWCLWRRCAARQVAFRRLRAQTERSIRASRWVLWRRRVVDIQMRILRMTTLTLHNPYASSSLALQCAPFHLYSSAKHTRFYRFAAHFYYIQWLRATMQRRGRRLQRYAVTLQVIEKRRKMMCMAESFRRWIYCTVSTLQCQRNATATRRVYFWKWFHFYHREQLCVAFHIKVLRRVKSHVWRRLCAQCTRCQVRRTRDEMADAFFVRHVQHRACSRVFGEWKRRTERHVDLRALRSAAVLRRRELLRELAVRRILNGVILSFVRPSEKELSNEYIMEDRDDALLHPVSASNEAGELRQRLLSRSAPIPLVHIQSQTVSLPKARVERDLREVSIQTESTSLSGINASGDDALSRHTITNSVGDVSPLDQSATAIDTQSCTFDFSVLSLPDEMLARGREVLTAYRALRATAAAEKDETHFVKEQLKLYATRRQGRKPMPEEFVRAESLLKDRLLFLQQRDLHRQAMRAQVKQVVEQLRVQVQEDVLSN